MLSTTIDTVKIYHNVTLVSLYGIDPEKLSRTRIFTTIANRGINLDMISQTPHLGGKISVLFTVPDEFLTAVFEILADFKKEFRELGTEVLPGNFTVSLASSRMVDTPGVAAEVFAAFDRAEIQVLLITTSDMSISCLFSSSSEVQVMHTLAQEKLV